MTRHINPHDFLKPPTAITAVSLAGVLTGAAHLDTRRGKFLAAVSRLGDLADGYVARRYDMSSDAGALADVVSDKLGMLAIGIGMWKHDIAPKPVLITMAAKHSLNAVATLYNGLGD
jgi:phosphatidylglycerophosphate synthase